MTLTRPFDFFVQLHLTERCNLRCKHCYQTGKSVNEMSFTEIKEAVTEISDTLAEWETVYGMRYSKSFNVTGGEPFLRNDIFDVIREIKTRGFGLYLLTNGIIVDEKKAKALSDLNVNGVQVSIEGPEEVHDSIRGKDSYTASMKGVRYLLDAGLNVTMNVTLSSMNADYFMDIIDIAIRTGVQRLGFSRLVPSGRGGSMLKEMLGHEQTGQLYNKIFSLNTGSLEIVTGDPVAAQSLIVEHGEDRGNIPSGGCAAGVSGITILPDGGLLPCRRLNISLGNIRKDSFREIWTASKVLEDIRSREKYKGRCRTCIRWAHCRGCRAIAYAYSRARGVNDFLAEDPQCFIDSPSALAL
jgi:AdoMet-dependent heme synthase